MNNLYYKPSGKVNPLSILYLLLAICIVVPILAIIYTYAILYIPLIYLNFLCVAGVAFGLGFIASFVIDLGKVRNVMLAVLFGLIIGLVGLYASWVIWLAHHYEQEYMDIAFNMDVLLAEIEYANEQGTWGIGRSGGLVNGTMLSIVWIIEAIGMIGFPIFFAYTRASEPFIENDDNWALLTPIGPFEFVQNKETLKQQLEAKNYEGLLTMPIANGETGASHCLLHLYHGEHINQAKEFYLSIVNMKEGKDKDGNIKFDENNLINFIHITKEAGQQVLARIANAVEETKPDSV